MNENFVPIKGYGYIKVGNKKYEFENRVNAAFLNVSNLFIDLQRLSRSTTTISTITQLNGVEATLFSLHAEPADLNFRRVYTRLVSIPASSFVCKQASFYKTTITGGGLAEATGVIKSGGFNVVTKPPVSTVIGLNRIERNISPVSLGRSITFPNTGSSPSNIWVYHPVKKAFYNFSTSAGIHKLEFNLETGEVGDLIQLYTTWSSPASNGFTCTDGKNTIYSLTGNNTIQVFDFITETRSLITTSMNVPMPRNTVCWDFANNCLREVAPGSHGGFTISTSGVVTMGTGVASLLYEPLFHYDDYTITIYAYEGRNPSNSVMLASFNVFSKGHYNIFDDNGVQVLFSRSGGTTDTISLSISMLPQTSMTIFPVSDIPVNAGDAIGIEYTFEVGY